jgi:hypothetical protein
MGLGRQNVKLRRARLRRQSVVHAIIVADRFRTSHTALGGELLDPIQVCGPVYV